MICIKTKALQMKLHCKVFAMLAADQYNFQVFLFPRIQQGALTHSLKALSQSSVLGKKFTDCSWCFKNSICFSFRCSWCFFLSHNLKASSGFLSSCYLKKNYKSLTRLFVFKINMYYSNALKFSSIFLLEV